MLDATPEILSVSQINARARVLLERHFALVAVAGEISGHKVVSGHHYFCLKDAGGQLNAVLFRREATQQSVTIENGVEVVARGRLTVYGAYGRYQMVVEHIQPRGAGALQAAFEQLKARLLSEGLFATERKRRLPFLPRRVAVVTSPTGAVVRDIVQVATRRWPGARILVVPTRVQGDGAAASVVTALGRVNAVATRMGIDVVILARGGGSLEDLWAFNEESVARAIHASRIPLVSAIGHETDVTIADFVADVRAPTPSAAAELVFPVRDEMVTLLTRQRRRLRTAAQRRLAESRMYLRALRAELGDGHGLLRDPAQRLSHACLRQQEAMRRLLLDRRLVLQALQTRLLRLHPQAQLGRVRARVNAAQDRMHLAGRQVVTARRERLRALASRLGALSPLGILQRGYALALSGDGQVVRSHEDVVAGDRVTVHLAQGRLVTRVEETLPSSAAGFEEMHES